MRLSAVFLFCAQLLLVSHLHAGEDDHGSGEAPQACPTCLFQSSSQDGWVPLPGASVETLVLVERAGTLTTADAVGRPAFRSQTWARGPPLAALCL